MSDLTILRTQLEQTADTVTSLPHLLWASCILYMLKVLDNRIDDTDYRGCLELLRRQIDTRLEVGRW